MKPQDYVLSPHTFVAAEACPAAAVYRGPHRKPSHAEWYGIAIHRFMEYAVEKGREPALAYIRRKFKRMITICEKIDVESLPLMEPEVQWIIDTVRGTSSRIHGSTLRSEASPKDHVSVKADGVCVNEPHVIDYKSGERVVDPATSVQSLLEGLALWMELGRPADGVKVSVVNILKTGELRWNSHQLSVQELLSGERRVRLAHFSALETRADRSIDGIEPEFRPGPHCERCSNRDVCNYASSAPVISK